MDLVNMAQLKSHLSAVISKVNQTGDAIVIGRYGKPIAKIIPFTEENSERKIGFAKHLLFTEIADLQNQVDSLTDKENLDKFYQEK